MKYLAQFLMLVTWAFGVAAAKGFWLTLVSVLFPPWAWVELAQFVLQKVT